MRVFTDEPVILKLSSRGIKIVTAGDIQSNADVEIVNRDAVIATVTADNFDFEMELTVRRGRGYIRTEDRTNEVHDLGTIAIDSLFSPVRNVGYRVENARVGEITNYDRLIMNIETDGSITPQDAVEQAVKMLIDYFSILLHNPATSYQSEQENLQQDFSENSDESVENE